MPELPECERGRAIAEGVCRGKTIERVYTANDGIVYEGVTPRKFASALRGRKVVGVHRRGKQLWMRLDGDGPHPLFHFGMTGSFTDYTDASDRHAYCKCELLMHDGGRLGFQNSRRLGRIKLRDDPENQEPVSELGPDPLTDPPTPKRFIGMLQGRSAVIKSLIMNQSFLAGVGNWIADEALYQAGIDPHRRSDNLSEAEARKLLAKIKSIVSRAVQSDADYRLFPDTWLFHHRWQVRESKNGAIKDSSGHVIRFDTIGGRTTSWVPAVQS